MSQDKDESEIEKEQKSPIYKFGEYATTAIMRISRKLWPQFEAQNESAIVIQWLTLILTI